MNTETDEEFYRRTDAHINALGIQPALNAWLQEGELRFNAAWTIRQLKNRSLIPDIVDKLIDRRDLGADRGPLIAMLGDLKVRRAVPKLLAVLDDEHVLSYVLEALGKIAPQDHIDAFRRYLDHPEAWIRIAASDALRRAGDASGIHVLVELADTDDEDLQREVAKALRRFKSHPKQAAEVLIGVLERLEAHDVQDHIAREIQYALGAITGHKQFMSAEGWRCWIQEHLAPDA